MKLRMICAIVFGWTCLILSLVCQAAPPDSHAPQHIQQGTLKVLVTGIRHNVGVIRIAMYNSKQTYEDKENDKSNFYRDATLPIHNGNAIWEVKNLPYGIYAIKMFHDKDMSDKFKQGFLGLPEEGYGFSNNPKVTTHAPSFDETKFTFDKPLQEININIIHPPQL